MNPRDLDDMIERIDQLTEPEPAATPTSYGQPAGFEEDEEPAPVGWLTRAIARIFR